MRLQGRGISTDIHKTLFCLCKTKLNRQIKDAVRVNICNVYICAQEKCMHARTILINPQVLS